LLAALGAQVERDPQLLGVVVVVAAAELDPAPLVHERADAAQDVPAPLPHRVLDADHLGAERRQPLGRAGAGQLSAEIADAHARQRLGRGLGRRLSRTVHTYLFHARGRRAWTSLGRTKAPANR